MIVTTALEEQLFSWLRDFQQDEECPSNDDLRIVGGWVRDKLMGSSTNDIDVALADCTGEVFAETFVAFVHRKYNSGQIGIHKVRANPEKSKHLATAKVRIIFMRRKLCLFRLNSQTFS